MKSFDLVVFYFTATSKKHKSIVESIPKFYLSQFLSRFSFLRYNEKHTMAMIKIKIYIEALLWV